MTEPAKTILFWGDTLFITPAFQQQLLKDFSTYQLLIRDANFQLKDSLQGPPDLLVCEVSDSIEPLHSIFSIWDTVPVLIIASNGSEELVRQAFIFPVTDYLIADKDGGYLTLLQAVCHRCLKLNKPRFSFYSEPPASVSNKSGPPVPDRSELDFKQLYALLRTMTDTVPDMIWAKDLEGKYIYANISTCKNLLNAQNTLEPIGKDMMAFVERERGRHPEDPQWYTYGEISVSTDQETLEQGILSRFQESGYVLGSNIILETYKAPLLDENGVTVGTVGAARDITLHEETKERYRKLFDHSPNPVVVHIEGILIAGNQAAANFIGAESIDEHLGAHISQFVHIDETAPSEDGVPSNLQNPEAAHILEEKYVTLDGAVRDVESTAVPIKYGNQNAWMVSFRDITDWKQAQAQLRRSLKEKEALLQEIFHRTKNNMQVISSIINIRSSELNDPTSIQMFKEIRDRIAAMSLAHDRLYAAQDLSAIDFKPYLEHLSNHLSHSYAETAQRVPIRIQAENIKISIDQAVPLGLVINEILTNAYKYAFPDQRSGHVDLSLVQGFEGDLSISIRDDGIGLPLAAFNDSLSTIIISGLVEDQLGGTMEYDGHDGTQFQIHIPDHEIIRRI